MKILESDVISGKLYLELIKKYKKYDKEQKEYIMRLNSELKTYKNELKLVHTIRKILIEHGIDKRKQQFQFIRDLVNKFYDSGTISEISSTKGNC